MIKARDGAVRGFSWLSLSPCLTFCGCKKSVTQVVSMGKRTADGYKHEHLLIFYVGDFGALGYVVVCILATERSKG